MNAAGKNATTKETAKPANKPLLPATPKAAPLLREAVEIAGAIGDRVNLAKGLLALAEVHRVTENISSAQESYSAALEAARAMALREVEWRALHGLAKIMIGKGLLIKVARLTNAVTATNVPLRNMQGITAL